MIPLKMNNWLPDTQKFKIKIDILEQPSPATFFVAANAVEVAPHGIKDFQIRFNSFVEGTTKATATFTNEQSGEYFFYDIEAKAVSAEVLDTINLESSVRQSARHLLSIENPLDAHCEVTMGPSAGAEWWSCDSKCIRVKELVGLSGQSEGSYEIEYRPLTPTKQPEEHLLTVMTKELGTFKYKVVVKATASSVRQTLHFEVPLGSVQAETFVFKAFNPTQTTFKCSVRQPALFSVGDSMTCPAVSAWDGDDARLSVTFEPTLIGEVRDVLTIASPEGGHYECELVGRCVPPLPLGPYNFAAGAPQAIPFRNCFDQTCQWSFVVDSPSFQVATASASVAAKSEGSCSVTFNHVADNDSVATAQSDTVTAKLFIRCDSKPDVPPWIVYLRGKM
jgi:hydrocephalus-inducing protein